ncbi:MAG: hypothetical protein M9933_06895 [Chitinophagaceae bacterium]|nr:hypothetical protein [Chitinophagaceae bacterium]
MKKIRLLGLSAILLALVAGGCKKDKKENCAQLITNFSEAYSTFSVEPSEENCTKLTNAAKALLNSECVSDEVRANAEDFATGCPV